MNDSPSTAPLVGSLLAPSSSYIFDFVSFLKKSCRDAVEKKQNGLIESHNSMALYTQQILNFATEHRAVTDPFFELNAFDIRNRTVLIEDKVVSSAHRVRIAWLPPQAVSQLDSYLSHLRSLSRYIRQENSILANQILAVTEPDYPHPIPLLFFLEETDGELNWIHIQPSTIKARLGTAWLLPLNTNRHLLSTWLHEKGCPSEVIDAQLGHIEAGCSPFSARSTLAPKMVGDIIIPYLESYLDEQGWSVIKGLSAPPRLPIILPPITSKELKATTLFGPEVRSINREQTLVKDVEAVLAIFKGKFFQDIPKVIPDSDIDTLQDKIISDSPVGRVLIRLTLFRRHLLKLKRSGTIVKIPGRLALANKEPSCFNSNSSSDAARVDEIGNRFLSYLSSKAGGSPSQERRIAEILIASSIFGAQSSLGFLDSIATGMVGCINRIGGDLIVDISKSSDSPIRRWIPSNLSSALLLGYCKNLDLNQAAPSADAVQQNIDEILQLIEAPRLKKKLSRKKSVSPPVSESLLPLISLSRSKWKFLLPGVIRAYAEGEIPCASVPLSNWLRLVTEESGSLHATSSNVPNIATCDEIQPISPITSDANFKQAKLSWSLIEKALSTARNDKSTGKNDERSNAKKRTIESKTLSLLKDKSKTFPPIAGLMAAWIIHLCRNGTSYKPNLAASSVITYSRALGERLINLAYDLDFLSLSDLQIEGIYHDLLSTATEKNRGYVAKRLKEFHLFLKSAYAMPEVDWSEIIDEDLLEADAVDAGIVTTKEYGEALDILLNDPNHPDIKDRFRHATILFFAYRFGLRTGEIIRLTVSDVILNAGEMVVYVRNSVHGETKTENGVRQLPLIGALSKVELDLVSKWLVHVETYADDDNLATLFSKISGKRDMADRSSSVRAVVEVLRLVTGDHQVRLRHLRHTCATRIFLAMILDDVPSGLLGKIYSALWDDVSPRDVRTVLVGGPRVSRRGLYAMALFMGHASPDVTHRHYVHLADIVLKEWVENEIVPIHDKAISYAFQTSYANVRKVRSRLGEGTSLASLTEHFLQQSTISIPKLQQSFEKRISSSTQIEPIYLNPADIDRMLSIATLRNSISGIADRFLTTDQFVTSTLITASQLQDQTGFSDFAIPHVSPEDHWVVNSLSRCATLDKESQRVRGFLNDLGRAAAPVESQRIASQIWIDAYHPNITYLIVSKRRDLQALLSAMETFGISPADFEAVVPANPHKDEHALWSATEEYLRSMGLAVRRDKRLSKGLTKSNSNNRIGLILQPGKKHKLGYQRTLNRALFVISVWASLPKARTNSVSEVAETASDE